MQARPNAGQIVSDCFGLGRNTIAQARSDGCVTVSALGAKVQAGPNSRSRKPHLAALTAPFRSHFIEAPEKPIFPPQRPLQPPSVRSA